MSQTSKSRAIGLTVGFVVGVLEAGFLSLTWFTSGGLTVIWALCAGCLMGSGSRLVRILDSRIKTVSWTRWGTLAGLLLLFIPSGLLLFYGGYEFDTKGISGMSKYLIMPLTMLITLLFVREEFLYYEVLSRLFERSPKTDEG